jgi:uncharacterized sporulation protein YeaH/YhbH (DUF444 family)
LNFSSSKFTENRCFITKRIHEDWQGFRDVISGRARRELKRLIKSGSIVRNRPKGGKMTISIPEIEIPHFAFGTQGKGIARGPGKEGDIIGRDPQPGKGNKAGDQSGEGIDITVDLDDVLKFMEEELKLPRMEPKPNETFEEVKIKYNDISKTGPESLRHTRRTIMETLKRLAMTKSLEKVHQLPGMKMPIRLIAPINSDRRYRQYKEIKIPSSNAVIFFARDCSGSMDDFRCDIVSDMAWWIDCWIKRFYKRVDRCYFVHDTRAMEVNEDQFYKMRYMGGTLCSSVFKSIAEQLENRYPPEAFNIYIFYFTDGDNWDGDNEKVVNIINEQLSPNIVNMIGISQICSWNYEGSVKKAIDENIKSDYLRSVDIGSSASTESSGNSWNYSPVNMDDETRDTQIIDAIRKLLGRSDAKNPV